MLAVRQTRLTYHAFMCRYRRHAIVIILIVAAIITPTFDIFTLLVVSLPMWLLYEGSILLVGRTAPRPVDVRLTCRTSIGLYADHP